MDPTIRPRAIAVTTNGIARAWAAAALMSLLLPATARRGLWLPVHLFTAGAVSTAIVGNAQVLARGLANAPDPSRALIVTQLGLVNVGALLVAVGVPRGSSMLPALGGALFVAGIAAFAVGLAQSWLQARNRRHGAAFVLYGASAAAMITGGLIGALLAGGWIGDATTWFGLRRAHVVVNLLGWSTLPILATMATMLPAALRTRAPGTPVWVAPALLAGLGLIGAGVAVGSATVGAAGGALWLAGTLGVVVRSAKAFAGGFRGRPYGPGLHLAAAVLWLAGTSVALTVALARGTAAFDLFRDVLLIGIVGGCIGQALGGAWLLLLPMHRPGDALVRRRLIAVLDRGAIATVAALNAGLVVLLVGDAGWVPAGWTTVGAIAAAAAAAVLLARTWLAPAAAARDAESAGGTPGGGTG